MHLNFVTFSVITSHFFMFACARPQDSLVAGENGNFSASANTTKTPLDRRLTPVAKKGDDEMSENELAERLAEISKNMLKSSSGLNLDLYNDLDTWEAPFDMKKNYPYYISGYDTERRPIWIEEFGRWNFRKMVETGGETLKTFDKYLDQVFYRVNKSVADGGTPDDPVDGAIIIMDLEDFSLRQLAHVPTAAFFIRVAARMQKIIYDNLHVGIGLNTNAFAQALLDFIRPHFGGIFEKMEVYGTNRARWVPHVLKYCPKDQIPAWYGGTNKDFKPAQVFG